MPPSLPSGGLSEYRGELSVELLKPKGVSLGISLRESAPREGGPFIISRVKEAGIADRCGALHAGDRLLSVNKESVAGKSITDVQHLLKHCDLVVELEIIQAHNFPECERRWKGGVVVGMGSSMCAWRGAIH
jgi:C-terminal processing protease CtpA/Prc